jgi:hypothetical protein
MQNKQPKLIGRLLHMVVERSARKLNYAELAQKLDASCGQVAGHIAAAPDTPANRAQAGHVIGMERWAQRRLRTALGEPPSADEYDGHRPSGDLALPALRGEFESTRAETLQLVKSLQQAGVPETRIAPHNDMGQLTLRGWLYYLDMHAAREAAKMK